MKSVFICYAYVGEAAVGKRIALIMDSHTTGSRLGWYGTLSTELLTDYHHNSIIKVIIR